MMTRWNQTLWWTMPSKSPLRAASRMPSRCAAIARCVLLQPRHGEPHRGFLQRAADVIDLVLRARMVVVHEGAAARPDRDQPGGFEIAERLAHRRLARAELAGELQLDQPFARRVVRRR